jgi:hypothetical protein
MTKESKWTMPEEMKQAAAAAAGGTQPAGLCKHTQCFSCRKYTNTACYMFELKIQLMTIQYIVILSACAAATTCTGDSEALCSIASCCSLNGNAAAFEC